jgi:carboxymethylenebutenolidase
VPEVIKLSVDSASIDALLGVPEGKGAHPAVLVAHHQEGLSPFTRDLIDKLAGAGYVAICPDHYHRLPPDATLETKRTSVRDSDVLKELAGGLDFLKRDTRVQHDQIAILGHCMGGRSALLGAGVFPGLRCAIIFYPTRMMAKPDNGLFAFEYLSKVSCPVIGFFGGRDRLIPSEDADQIEAELRRHGVSVEFHRYPNAGHAYCNFTSAADYREEAARDSWNRALASLRIHLRR